MEVGGSDPGRKGGTLASRCRSLRGGCGNAFLGTESPLTLHVNPNLVQKMAKRRQLAGCCSTWKGGHLALRSLTASGFCWALCLLPASGTALPVHVRHRWGQGWKK